MQCSLDEAVHEEKNEGSKSSEKNPWILVDLPSSACICCAGYLLFGLCFPLLLYKTMNLLLVFSEVLYICVTSYDTVR